MSYADFIHFILSVEEKSSYAAIEYWFRVIDIDGDGVISLYEMQLFYEQQYEKMLTMESECWSFDDFVCSLFVF